MPRTKALSAVFSCYSFSSNLPCDIHGVNKQILSYISSYVLINEIQIDPIFIFRDLCSKYSAGDADVVEFFEIHQNISRHYFDYSLTTDEFSRISPYDFRNAIGVDSNNPRLDILFNQIILEYVDEPFQPKSYVLMTHDIDKIGYVENPFVWAKSILGDLFKRKMFYPFRILHFLTKRSVHSRLKILFDDPFSRVTLLLPRQDQLHSDYDLETFISSCLDSNMETEYGLHYSIPACRDSLILEEELSRLKAIKSIRFTRPHYLARSPEADYWLCKHSLIDLSPCDNQESGFFLPTSYPFLLCCPDKGYIFTLNTTFMDVTLHFMPKSSDFRKSLLCSYATYVHDYGGIFTVNWHNTSFMWGSWPREKLNYQYLKSILISFFLTPSL